MRASRSSSSQKSIAEAPLVLTLLVNLGDSQDVD